MVLGSHGDLMVPLPEFTTAAGVSVKELIPSERLEQIIDRTRKGGGEIVSLLKTGSAFYAPAASAARMVKAILSDEKALLPCAVYTNGEYGISGTFVGLPCILGAQGVEKIVELPMLEKERVKLLQSVEEVKQGVQSLKELGFAIS
jgi:malate dehydrogenase